MDSRKAPGGTQGCLIYPRPASGGILRSLPSLPRDPSKEPTRLPFDLLRTPTPADCYGDSCSLNPNEVALGWYACPIDAATAGAYTISVGIFPERWKVTFKEKSTVHLAVGMVGAAISAMLLGALLICATSWKVPGWVIVTYGLLILYLAHHVSAAPCWDEPDAELRARSPSRTNADGKERLEERIAEALAKHRI